MKSLMTWCILFEVVLTTVEVHIFVTFDPLTIDLLYSKLHCESTDIFKLDNKNMMVGFMSDSHIFIFFEVKGGIISFDT